MSPTTELSPARHEPRDVGGRFIAAGVALVLATLAVLLLLVLWLFPDAPADRLLRLPLPAYPDPQLQTSPPEDMAQFEAQELTLLNGTGWIDKSRGIVHIPIADAMRKIADDGIPGWPAAAKTP